MRGFAKREAEMNHDDTTGTAKLFVVFIFSDGKMFLGVERDKSGGNILAYQTFE